MDMRRASRSMDAFVRKELGELLGEEFPCVVAVKRAYHARGRGAAFVHGFEPSVIVYNGERVSASAIDRRKERSGDIDVDEASRVRRFVQFVWVSQSSRVGLGAGGARGRRSVPQALWRVSREFRELFQASTATVQSTMHVVSGVIGGHYLDVGRGP
eukprot:1289807-Pleurochrysis_carterae.AAC.3